MKLTSVLAAAILLVSAPAFAGQHAKNGTWSGFLVDSSCYAALERNSDPWDTSTYVDRDREWEVRYCAPSTKTKTFALVDHDSMTHELDAEGNTQAADLVRRIGKKVPMEATVAGEQRKDTIQVNSILPPK